MDDVYEQRFAEFGEHYEDFEPSDVVALIARTGEWLDMLLLDRRTVSDAMMLIYERVIGTPKRPEDAVKSWRELWDDVGLNQTMEPQRAQFMVELNAFAFWGLRPRPTDMDDPRAKNVEEVEAFVAEARAFLDAIPPGWGNVANLGPTVLAAEARIRLDTGKGVTPEQLAALARISLKSMKNTLAPGNASGLKLDASGEVPAPDALRWLKDRPDFKTSIWLSEDAAKAIAPAAAGVEDIGEVVFVPTARDGTWFDPVLCRNPRGYIIGAKGAEAVVEDYREALDRLARMSTPHWRRPNDAGNWGLVAGVGWQRKVVRELPSAPTEAA